MLSEDLKSHAFAEKMLKGTKQKYYSPKYLYTYQLQIVPQSWFENTAQPNTMNIANLDLR